MNSGIQILTLSLQCFFLIWWEVIWGPSHVSFRSHHLNLWSGRLCLSLSKMVSLFHFNGAGWKWRDEDADTFYTELRLLPNMTRFTWDAKVRGSCEMPYSDRGEVGTTTITWHQVNLCSFSILIPLHCFIIGPYDMPKWNNRIFKNWKKKLFPRVPPLKFFQNCEKCLFSMHFQNML